MAKKRRSPRSRKTPSARPMPWWRRWWLWALLVPLLLGGTGATYLDYLVRSKFEGKKWALPARVYARPLEVYAGLTLSRGELVEELRALGYQFVVPVSKPGRATVNQTEAGATVTAYTRGFTFWDKAERPQAFRASFTDGVVTELVDLDGEPLSIVRLEPQEIGGIYPAHMEDRLLVRLQDIPPLLGETLIAVEDRYFLEHHGISLRGIARAAYANLRAGGVVQGGSTLTQQLVKNFYLNHERSLTRKGLEAIMALSLDWHYSKSEILETYLNEVYLGQSGARGIHGFALGARHYFRQPLDELKTHQIAFLVGVVKGASYYNPWQHPERALERRNLVLQVMEDTGLINAFEATVARRQPLDVVAEPHANVYSYPGFIDVVKRQLQRDYQEDDLRSEGLRVFTTLAPHVQRAAERALDQRLTRLEEAYQLPAETLQGSVVVSEVGSGEVLAVVGDRQPGRSGFNRALESRRAIGSLVKPAVYLAALNQPETYNLTSPVDDSPVIIAGDNGSEWQPRNFSRESHGTVPVYRALSDSYNQATTRLGMELGLEAVANTLRLLGVTDSIPQLPSVLLGAIDLSPMQVNNVYQTIAGEGVYTPPRAIRSVLDATGQPLNRYALESDTRFKAETTHLLQWALQKSVTEGTGKTLYSQLAADFTVAGKTGTTNQQRDSWFAGFTADHLAVVWVGRDDYQPTPLTGATGAMRVWGDLFTAISSRPLMNLAPPGVSYHWVDPLTGTLSREGCEGAEYVPYIKGTEPQEKGRCQGGFPWFGR